MFRCVSSMIIAGVNPTIIAPKIIRIVEINGPLRGAFAVDTEDILSLLTVEGYECSPAMIVESSRSCDGKGGGDEMSTLRIYASSSHLQKQALDNVYVHARPSPWIR